MTLRTAAARPFSRALRSLLVVAVVAASALAGAAIPAASANATGETGSIHGSVRVWDPMGTKPANVTPYAVSLAGGEITVSQADGLGNYRFDGLPVGDYVLYVQNWSACDVCMQKIWSGNTPYRSAAEIITVSASSDTVVDFLSPLGGGISGTVTRAAGLSGVTVGVTAILIDPGTGELSIDAVFSTFISGSGYTLRQLPPGDYLVRFAPSNDVIGAASYWEDGQWIADASLVTVDGTETVTGIDATVGETPTLITRFAGADRFEMAVGLSQVHSPGVQVVFVANGLDFPDALSAGPAAAHLGGPILLVRPDAIPDVVASELDRLAPQRIIVVGGTNSVRPAVFDQLGGYADEVTRIDGATRFDSSRNLVATAFDSARTVYIATGNTFPDALSAGGAAGSIDAPVLLVNGHSDSVNPADAALLASLGTTRVIIAGGPASVSPEYLRAVADLPGVVEVTRRAGRDRFEASFVINQQAFPAADVIMLATGLNFPDALAGGPLAGAWGAPTYLIGRDCVPYIVVSVVVSKQPHLIVVLGGPNSLSPAIDEFIPCME